MHDSALAAPSLVVRASELLRRAVSRVVPDPFVLALLLTALVLALGAAKLAADGAEGIAWTVALGWLDGFKSPAGLAFALQMCLVLVTGHALATSPPVQSLVRRLAALPRSSAGAAFLVAAVGCVASVIHWGLGAIVGALLAREVAHHAAARGVRLHYALLGGAAYAGFSVWHGGLSGSAPLKAAEPGNFLEPVIGLVPLSATLFSPLNLLVTGSLVLAIPALFWLLAPRDGELADVPDLPHAAPEQPRTGGALGWLQQSRVPGVAAGAALLGVLVAAVASDRMALDLNAVNLLFLSLGVALQGSLGRYAASVADGARGAGAIVLQFPFYFGILGVMQASGLIETMSRLFLEVATPATFPVLAFLSAGLVNLFIPSGGGQWAVQGPILAEAARALGADPGAVILAFSYGDAWTNALQPFWALPLLGIMRLQARDVIGYTALVFLLMGAIVIGLLLAFA